LFYFRPPSFCLICARHFLSFTCLDALRNPHSLPLTKPALRNSQAIEWSPATRNEHKGSSCSDTHEERMSSLPRQRSWTAKLGLGNKHPIEYGDWWSCWDQNFDNGDDEKRESEQKVIRPTRVAEVNDVFNPMILTKWDDFFFLFQKSHCNIICDQITLKKWSVRWCPILYMSILPPRRG
jgi:hypothetical protein